MNEGSLRHCSEAAGFQPSLLLSNPVASSWIGVYPRSCGARAVGAASVLRDNREARQPYKEFDMWVLVLGLLIFLGVHSIRIVADPWRSAQIARFGDKAWKGLYALASVVGIVLGVWGR